jgi:uncharacterized membrane protein
VLHVNDHPPGDGPGGAEIFLARLLTAQRAAGHVVDILSGDDSHTGLRAALAARIQHWLDHPAEAARAGAAAAEAADVFDPASISNRYDEVYSRETG